MSTLSDLDALIQRYPATTTWIIVVIVSFIIAVLL